LIALLMPSIERLGRELKPDWTSRDITLLLTARATMSGGRRFGDHRGPGRPAGGPIRAQDLRGGHSTGKGQTSWR
jgi:hypothetical protein